MKLIMAVVKPFKLDEVREALVAAGAFTAAFCATAASGAPRIMAATTSPAHRPKPDNFIRTIPLSLCN